MLTIRILEDPEDCERLWRQLWPVEQVFDLHELRWAFASAFQRRPFFLVAERAGRPAGLLALARLDDGGYGFWPGETWHGKTWVEQNRVPAEDDEVFAALLAAAPGPALLRYMRRRAVPASHGPLAVDELNYFFDPMAHGYDFERYLARFSGKSRKQLGREIAALEALGLAWRIDEPADLEQIFTINVKRFGADSFFADPRFRLGFETMALRLIRLGMARITTVLLGGEVAAVDLGALVNGTYTLLGGCTRAEFPGVAKLINFHHLRHACERRFARVDFLCGDFNWKQRFHLGEQPFHELRIQAGAGQVRQARQAHQEAGRVHVG